MNPHYRDVYFAAGREPEGGWPKRFAVITAWNPMDRETSEKENEAAHARLRAKVAAKGGLESFGVTGFSRDMRHSERGLGITLESVEEAVAWGKEFEQRAVFWIEEGMLWLVSCEEEARECLGKWDQRRVGDELRLTPEEE